VVQAARAQSVPAQLVIRRLVDAAVNGALLIQRRLRGHKTRVQLEAVLLVRALVEPPSGGEVDQGTVDLGGDGPDRPGAVARGRGGGRGGRNWGGGRPGRGSGRRGRSASQTRCNGFAECVDAGAAGTGAADPGAAVGVAAPAQGGGTESISVHVNPVMRSFRLALDRDGRSGEPLARDWGEGLASCLIKMLSSLAYERNKQEITGVVTHQRTGLS
jgi:hypothetical protein